MKKVIAINRVVSCNSVTSSNCHDGSDHSEDGLEPGDDIVELWQEVIDQLDTGEENQTFDGVPF